MDRTNKQNLKESLWIGMTVRDSHKQDWLGLQKLPFYELMADNLLEMEDTSTLSLAQILSSKSRPFLHSVSMNIGGTAPFNWPYLSKLKDLYKRLNPIVISDHLCVSSGRGFHSHNLLPIPLTRKNLERIARRTDCLQEFFQRPLMIENIAASLKYKSDNLLQLEFLNCLSNMTGCGILLDLSNLFIYEQNLGIPAKKQLEKLDKSNVWQYHLGGYLKESGVYIDSHDKPLSKQTMNLFLQAVQSIGKRPTIIERDDNHSFDTLIKDRRNLIEYLGSNRIQTRYPSHQLGLQQPSYHHDSLSRPS